MVSGEEVWGDLSGDVWNETLFDGFPEPVLLLREGRVAYRNRAASERFPGLRAGDEVPGALKALLGEAVPPAAAAGEVDGWSCTATLQLVGGDTLVVLRSREGVRPGLERLSLQLRRETATLSAALQRLDPTEEVPDEEKAKRYLAAANQGLYRIIRLSDHLALTSSEADWQPRSMDLAGLCRETAEEVEGVCRMGGYDFTWSLETSGLLTVGDDRLLRRMLLCLVSNAMKAAGRTGKLGLKLSVRGDRAVVTVWNTGRTLGEQDVARMFGGDLASVPTDPMQGLGLGLEVVRRAAALHGGAVLAESRDGVTRCVISLPIRKPEREEPLRTPRVDYSGGFLPVLVELSDVLPPELYNFEDLQ